MKQDNDEILVTVIVPAYNHQNYILECLNSINNQTYREFQWIVVDDGSKDDTPIILSEQKEKFGYDLIIQKNKGLSATLTDIIKNHAKGKYIAGCASDDYWVPEKLEKQIKFMENHPEYALCYGDTYYVDKNSSKLDNYNLGAKYYSGYVFDKILCQKFHPPVNYMIKKSVLEEMNFYPNGVIAEDFYMNCKISYKYPLGYIDEKLSFYRVEELSKKRNPWVLYSSHLDTIQMYKGNEYYDIAINCFNYRVFTKLSSYKKYKLLSIRYMFKLSIKDIFTISFIKGVVKLFVKWEV